MMAELLEIAFWFATSCVSLAMLLTTLRLILGPALQDRVLALDTLWMCAMQLVILFGLRLGRDQYFELALLIALTGFVSTLALIKFLMRGEVIE